MNELSLHVLDILGNSVRAGATRIGLSITESRSKNIYRILFEDDGRGMPQETLDEVFNPWMTSRKERRVGMGLCLLKQAAELCGGRVTVVSNPGEGTRVEALFEYLHLDRPVAGDLAGTVVMTAASSPEVDLVYTHTTDTGEYHFSSREVREVLEGTTLDNAAIMQAVQEMVEANLAEIKAEGDTPAVLVGG